jgi:hypothetical protein
LAAGEDNLPGCLHRSRPAGRPRHRHPLDPQEAINDAIRNGASMREVREFAGHAHIRTTEVYFVRKKEDAEVAAPRIQIRVTGSRGRRVGHLKEGPRLRLVAD